MEAAHVTFTDAPRGTYRGRHDEISQGMLGAPEQVLVTDTQQLQLTVPIPRQPTHMRLAPAMRRRMSDTWRRSASISPPPPRISPLRPRSLPYMPTSDALVEYT